MDRNKIPASDEEFDFRGFDHMPVENGKVEDDEEIIFALLHDRPLGDGTGERSVQMPKFEAVSFAQVLDLVFFRIDNIDPGQAFMGRFWIIDNGLLKIFQVFFYWWHGDCQYIVVEKLLKLYHILNKNAINFRVDF
jgi:hypothetical protein